MKYEFKLSIDLRTILIKDAETGEMFMVRTRQTAEEITRDVDRVGAPAAGPRGGRDRRQRRHLGKTTAHLVVKPVLCHREKILAAVLPEIVAKPPVIGDAGDRVPLGGTQRVRPDIIDQRRQQLAVVGQQGQAGVRRHQGADLLPESVPAAQPVQWIVLRRHRNADRGEGVGDAECEDYAGQIERDRSPQSAPPIALQGPGDDQHGRRHVGRCRPIGLGARQKADAEHHRQGWQRESSQQTGARVGESARARDNRQQGGEAERAEDAELRYEELDKRDRMKQRAGQLGIVADVQIADKAASPIPPEIR